MSAEQGRAVRAVAVQPKWGAADFASAARFRNWTHAQMESARPHLHPEYPNLVALTELNGLPLLLRGAGLAARAGTFKRAAALLFIHHLPAALPILLRERVSPVRALGLACADVNAALYLDTCRALAREYGVWLLCGTTLLPHYRLKGVWLRRDGSGLYNAAIILNPQGELVGCTDKVHLTPDEQEGGLDLTPGALEALRVHPTPAGNLGVATSLDAFRPDVVDRLAALGCTVLLQPDANGSPWTGKENIYPADRMPRDQPLAWLESSWAVTARGEIPYAVNPMVVGNLLDLSFDGQSAICGPAREAPEPRGYVMTIPRPGFLALLPWVTDGPPQSPHQSSPQTLQAQALQAQALQAQALRARGQALAAGSGLPGENGYRSGVIHADLHPPLRPVPGTDPTPTEQALAAYLRGAARFAPSPLLRLSGVWPLLGLLSLGLLALAGAGLARGRRTPRR